jgi:hypothetical protein
MVWLEGLVPWATFLLSALLALLSPQPASL